MKIVSVASRVQANLEELFKGKLIPGDAYIKFQLTTDITALLSMAQVQESLIVETKNITALPNMPDAVIGMMSSRDRVFCVFDLARLLSLDSALITPRQYQILLLESVSEPSIQIGLAVSSLRGIIRLLPQQVQPASAKLSGNLESYIDGVMQEEYQEVPILNFASIWETLTVLDSK